MTVVVTALVNGIPVALELDDDALSLIASAVPESLHPAEHDSPYMTIPEAAEYLRCKRQRIDDLLSQGLLTRFKDGRRTLVSRAEIDVYPSRTP